MPEIEAAQTPEIEGPYPSAYEQFPRVRQSTLATFDLCPLEAKFDLEYRKDWSGHPQGRGQIFHRFAAKALHHMANQQENTLDPEDALTILRECLRQHDVDARDVVTIPFSQIKDLRWVVVKWAHDNQFDMQHLADIEQRLVAPVLYDNPEGGWTTRIVSGQLDALFIPEPDWAVVIDWKDTWSLPPADELSESGYFQQRCYGFLVMTRYSAIQRVTLREHYVRYSESREATIFRSELPKITEEMAALVERFDRAVAEGTWPLPEPPEMPVLWTPSPGAHCNYCPRIAACPIFPSARVDGAIENEEMARQWAGEQIVAKAAVKQRNSALRAWAAVHGAIPVKHAKDPKRVLGFRESERTARPTKEELERAIEETGGNVDPNTLYKTTKQSRFEPHTRQDVAPAAEDIDLVRALEESIAQHADEG